eukprot:scaffold818_cov136-Cylindrotheca_fusiformis.AAC.9
MQLQTLFDSMCRCFGHEDLDQGNGNSSVQAGIAESSSQISARRRTNRLELKDKQWDELFEKTSKVSSKGSSPPKKGAKEADGGVVDMRNAHAVAQAKLAANPPHRNKPNRKRSAQAREEIFRSKNANDNSAASCGAASGNGLSRLWGNPSLALCFATPVRGTSEEPEETDRSVDASDTATLNTCEDTITSTVFFENKYSHITETRPPMPLFNQFKIGNEKDEISSIMNSDSHSSVNLIKLLQKQQQRGSNRHNREHEMEDVPKAVSTSTDSSRDSNKAAHKKMSV